MAKKKVTISIDPALDQFLAEICDRVLTSQIRSGTTEWPKMDRSKVISAILWAVKEARMDFYQARTVDEIRNVVRGRIRPA